MPKKMLKAGNKVVTMSSGAFIYSQPRQYIISAICKNVVASPSNPTVIEQGDSVTLIFTADGVNYKVPTVMPVISGATGAYSRISDMECSITLTNPTGNVSFMINGIDLLELCFTANTAGSTVELLAAGSPPIANTAYSTDRQNWITFTPSTAAGTNVITLSQAGDKVYFRNDITGNLGLTSQMRFVMSGSISGSGNTNSMYTSTGFSDITALSYEYCFAGLFRSCISLTTPPSLPAVTLSEGVYYNMFRQCTALTYSPDLPAGHLPQNCYYCMFYGCSSLQTAGRILADTADDGYYSSGYYSPCAYMFQNCTGLISAPPELKSCSIDLYVRAFSGCTSLTVAPALPATILGDQCYQSMFQDCTALTVAPSLPATTIAMGSYYKMFQGCTALTVAPSLPATTIASHCYQYMFYGCTSLATPPTILPAMVLDGQCYYYMFYGCSSLSTAPELPATTLGIQCYNGMFWGCSSLLAAPTLPALELTGECYLGMFKDCTSLTVAPELPATTLAVDCYTNTFYGCTKLVTPPSVLPATTLAKYCYRFMFEFTSLTCMPRLATATTLVSGCYLGMFDDVKTLNVSSTQTAEYSYAWTAPASAYCSGMFGSDDGQSEWAKLDGQNFPNNGTPTEGVTYYFKTRS